MKKKILFLFFINFLIIFCSASLNDWDYWDGENFLRFTFNFEDNPSYEVIEVKDERLFVVDVETEYNKETEFQNLNRGNVESIRVGAFRPGITRLVIKLKYVNEVRVYKASEEVDGRYKIFVDVDDFFVPGEVKDENEAMVVTIDPGHGGFDPGAINHTLGIMERDICLDIALKIRWIFQNMDIDDIKIKLTRDEDVFLPLRRRADIANNNKSDLFISLHADSSHRSSASGASFYYFSNVSSSAEANWLAVRENNEVIVEQDNKNKEEINLILNDILMNTNQKVSADFAGIVKSSFKRNEINILGRGIFSAKFDVLKFSKSPALLLEVGFLSNSEETHELKSSFYRYELAKTISSAIIDYYNKFEGDYKNVEFPEVKIAEEMDGVEVDSILNFYTVKSDFLIPKYGKGGI
ncbi:MAG: N-acetylmuramoyl-L-alanine amidase [Candidatus Muiribacteriota bacterium]